MKCVWFGSTSSPSSSATNYQYVPAATHGVWDTTETNKVIPLSDAVYVTKLRVWVQTAPGAGTQFAFTLRAAAADTAATVTISGTNTEATWTGRISLSQLNLVAMKSVPTGTPGAPGFVHWVIEYETAGDTYIVLGGTKAQNIDADLLFAPFGGSEVTPVSTTAHEAVIPTTLTVTKLAAYVVSTGTNNYNVRKNNTTDSSFTAAVASGNNPAVSSTGTLTFAPGDTMSIHQNDSGALWTRHAWSFTVQPNVPGEIVIAHCSAASPSTTATEYEGPQGHGDNDWDPTESNVQMRFPACRAKNLYVKLTTATGAGKTRAFTLRNGADTSVVATLTNTATGNDTTNIATIAEGDLVSMKMVPTGTPAATAGAHFSFTMMVDQPWFAAMF